MQHEWWWRFRHCQWPITSQVTLLWHELLCLLEDRRQERSVVTQLSSVNIYLSIDFSGFRGHSGRVDTAQHDTAQLDNTLISLFRSLDLFSSRVTRTVVKPHLSGRLVNLPPSHLSQSTFRFGSCTDKSLPHSDFCLIYIRNLQSSQSAVRFLLHWYLWPILDRDFKDLSMPDKPEIGEGYISNGSPNLSVIVIGKE